MHLPRPPSSRPSIRLHPQTDEFVHEVRLVIVSQHLRVWRFQQLPAQRFDLRRGRRSLQLRGSTPRGRVARASRCVARRRGRRVAPAADSVPMAKMPRLAARPERMRAQHAAHRGVAFARLARRRCDVEAFRVGWQASLVGHRGPLEEFARPPSGHRLSGVGSVVRVVSQSPISRPTRTSSLTAATLIIERMDDAMRPPLPITLPQSPSATSSRTTTAISRRRSR